MVFRPMQQPSDACWYASIPQSSEAPAVARNGFVDENPPPAKIADA